MINASEAGWEASPTALVESGFAPEEGGGKSKAVPWGRAPGQHLVPSPGSRLRAQAQGQGHRDGPAGDEGRHHYAGGGSHLL